MSTGAKLKPHIQSAKRAAIQEINSWDDGVRYKHLAKSGIRFYDALEMRLDGAQVQEVASHYGWPYATTQAGLKLAELRTRMYCQTKGLI